MTPRGIQPRLIVHSDGGNQYRSGGYVVYSAKYGIRRNMILKGSCYDNEVIGSFYARFKVEPIDAKKVTNRSKRLV